MNHLEVNKILLIPMAAMAETGGPAVRTVRIARTFQKAGMQVAVCAAQDGNFHTLEGGSFYQMSVPFPLGLPGVIASHTFPVAEKLGITARKTVHSFEEVCFLTGALDYRYLRKSVKEIVAAIQEFQPDAIYSEFNLSAVIAGISVGLPVYASYSRPAMPDYASSPQFASGVNRILRELGQPEVTSTLELFLRTKVRFIPSCPELEPMEDTNAVYCGSLYAPACLSPVRNKVLVYMGNGTISQKRMVREISLAFSDCNTPVYIAGRGLANKVNGTIHIAARFPFTELLPETALFINHGGQNSVIDGLVHGVPQLIFPGKVFERKYNAKSVQRNGAGLYLSTECFQADEIRRAANKVMKNPSYAEKAMNLGQKLQSLGGAEQILNTLRR